VRYARNLLATVSKARVDGRRLVGFNPEQRRYAPLGCASSSDRRNDGRGHSEQHDRCEHQ
jgi:hypothetical protein